MSSILLRDRNASLQQSPDITADHLAQFFVDKVNGVRAATENPVPPTLMMHDGQCLSNHQEVSIDDVQRVLLNSPLKTCAADPLPTSMLCDVADTQLPFIWVMCNLSLRKGHLLESQKAAIITPVLKKPNADPDELKNYRPISNLTFIWKVIEHMVVKHITRHLKDANLIDATFAVHLLESSLDRNSAYKGPV